MPCCSVRGSEGFTIPTTLGFTLRGEWATPCQWWLGVGVNARKNTQQIFFTRSQQNHGFLFSPWTFFWLVLDFCRSRCRCSRLFRLRCDTPGARALHLSCPAAAIDVFYANGRGCTWKKMGGHRGKTCAVSSALYNSTTTVGTPTSSAWFVFSTTACVVC